MTKEICLPADVQLNPVTLLKAGELSCLYELGKLRYIRRGTTELLRMVYAPVRSLHWITLPCTIEDEEIIIGKDSFSIQYTAVYKEEVPVYKARFIIAGKADSSISFSMKGEAVATFQKNRIGICIHHPVKECAGRAVAITKPDGSNYQSVFPEMVSPHQPFLDVQQMQWTTEDNTTVQLFFEGDIFETEDQRNWSDSSYKTYSTPLHIPFPVKLEAGDTIEQQLILTISGNTNNAGPVASEIKEEKIAFPKIGFSKSFNQPLPASQLEWLKKIPFHHYRVMLFMHKQEWKKELTDAFTEAAQLNAVLELVVVFSDQFADEINSLLVMLKEKQALLYSILVLHKNQKFSPADLLVQLYPIIKNSLPAVKTGYGTNTNFVDLNRNRPVENVFDFVSFSLHPQAHMTDSRSILENLDNQPDMIATAKSFAPGKQVFVSPVTIKDRYDIPPAANERQHTAFAAWWLLMSIQQLSMADSITFCELYGATGLIQIDNGIIPSSPFYEALAAIHTFQPVWIIKRYAGNNLLMDGLLLENAEGEKLFFRATEELMHFRN